MESTNLIWFFKTGGEACEACMDFITSLIAKNTTKLCIPGGTSQTLAVMDLESLVGREDGLDMGPYKNVQPTSLFV